MRIGKLGIERDTERLISDGEWIGWWSCWLYIQPTIPKLIWQMITEFKHDRHLVG